LWPLSWETRPLGKPIRRARSAGGAALLLAGLPIPGKQVGDFVGGVIWKPGQHVSEPGLRIDVVHLAGFDQGIDSGGTMAVGSRLDNTTFIDAVTLLQNIRDAVANCGRDAGNFSYMADDLCDIWRPSAWAYSTCNFWGPPLLLRWWPAIDRILFHRLGF